MRPIAAPVCGCPPSGARIRTRLRVDADDERVLWAVGAQLGGLAGLDLAARCRRGAGDDQRAGRKRALTAAASSRWAGTITPTSNDQWERGRRKLLDAQAGLWRACRTIRSRLAVPVGGRCGRVRGYASRADGYVGMPAGPSGSKSRAAFSIWRPGWHGGGALAQGRVSVCRGAGGSPSSATAWTVATWR
jgi:hypothetical protein